MGRLDTRVTDTPLRTVHDRIARRLLDRVDGMPDRTPDDVLVGTYLPEAIAIARQNWEHRTFHEHRSAAVFSNLLPQLMHAEAPMEVKTAVLRSSLDELRHAQLSAEVVEFLGGEPVLETDLTPEVPAEHPGVPPVERALRNTMFVGCLSETLAVGMLTEEREMCQEPYITRVIQQLLADETLHARVGWVYLQAVWPTLDAEARARTEAYVPPALRFFERELMDASHIGYVDPAIRDDARALGFSDPQTAREIFEMTVHEVIVPRFAEIGITVGNWRGVCA
jgi:bacterioferritin (cytochrome b1)